MPVYWIDIETGPKSGTMKSREDQRGSLDTINGNRTATGVQERLCGTNLGPIFRGSVQRPDDERR